MKRISIQYALHTRVCAGLCLLVMHCAIQNVFASDTAKPAVPAETHNIVVLGDSLAAGYGLEPEESFPSLLQKKINDQKWNFTVVNAGLSGDTSAGGLRRISWLLRQKVDVLLVELGGNDGLRGIMPETTKTNLQTIIDKTKSRYPEAQIVIAGMKMPPNMGEDYQKRFQNIFTELAHSNDIPLVPFLLEGVGGRADLNQGDRIHPTAAGQRIVADNVWTVLRPLLERMQSASRESVPAG
jgi:acyl-CoA thioesterase-1